jgi:hypothetical protein
VHLNISTASLIWKGLFDKRYITRKTARQYDSLDEGCKKIDSVLDIESLVDLKTNVDMLMRLVTNRKQRWLLKHIKFGRLMRAYKDPTSVETLSYWTVDTQWSRKLLKAFI